MGERLADWSPRRMARITGLFYLLTIVAGIFAEGFVSNRLVVSGDAAATANNILMHTALFRASFTVYLIEMSSQIVSIALFYELLKPVSQSVSLIAAFLGLAGCTIKTVGRLFYIAPTFLLGGAPYLKALTLEQVHALALLLLRVNDEGAAVSLAFFGFHALLSGWLIFKSTFLPRILGAWSMIAGVGWLTFLYPPLGYRLFPYLAVVGFLGALATIVWLLVLGVNETRWKEIAAAGEWRFLS